jgi:hypothetical protein
MSNYTEEEVDALNDWAVKARAALTVEARIALDGLVISGSMDELILQLLRVRVPGLNFLHADEVSWLREAIDDKKAKEATK